MRRISARPGSPWRRDRDAVKFARTLRAIACLKAAQDRDKGRELQAALARERMHQRH